MALPIVEPAEPWVPADTFGARLALVRQVCEWNVAEAAKACGVSHSSWRNWEHTSTSPRNLEEVARKIAAVTGCEWTWLMVGGPLRSR
jgi:transcriptional regulator with XRE-family HTH domain